MEIFREIIDADQLLPVMNLPQALRHLKVEVTISPVSTPGRTEKSRLTRKMIDDMLPGSITESLTGVLPLTDMTLEEIRAERLSKYL
jgi:hypothetical protein